MFIATVKRDPSVTPMKKSMIPWHVFRAALKVQTGFLLESWLGRWRFTDEGVYLIGQQRSTTDLRVSVILDEQERSITGNDKSQFGALLRRQYPPTEPNRLMGTNPPIRGHSFREL